MKIPKDSMKNRCPALITILIGLNATVGDSPAILDSEQVA